MASKKKTIYSVTVNVMPVGDIYPHDESVTCSCGPEIEKIGGGKVIIHNAWDGREAEEEDDG